MGCRLIDSSALRPVSPHPYRQLQTQRRLHSVLLNRGVELAPVPAGLKKVLVEVQCCEDEVKPSYVRQLLRQKFSGGAWPATQDDAQFLLAYCMKGG